MMKKWIYVWGLSLLILLIGGCTGIESTEPPFIVIKINGEDIDSVKGGYEWSVKKWFTTETTIADALAPNQIAEEFELKVGEVDKGSIAAISFSDESKPVLQAYLWDERSVVKDLSISEQEIILPSEMGRHIIEVRGKWSTGEASYTFVIEVN